MGSRGGLKGRLDVSSVRVDTLMEMIQREETGDARERGELAEAKPLKRTEGMGPAAWGLGFSRSRMLPPEHQERR